MLAASRTERVIGRIIFLTISIKTMNGIKAGGVPKGTRWAKNSVSLLINLYTINPNHKGRANESVIAKWLVDVKVKAINPNVLFIRIKKNKDKKIRMLDFFDFSKSLNSVFIAEIILRAKNEKGALTIQ